MTAKADGFGGRIFPKSIRPSTRLRSCLEIALATPDWNGSTTKTSHSCKSLSCETVGGFSKLPRYTPKLVGLPAHGRLSIKLSSRLASWAIRLDTLAGKVSGSGLD